MEMQLVVGGTYSGKRRVVKEAVDSPIWISAYNGETLSGIPEKWEPGRTLVLEGWEKWLAEELEVTEEEANLDIIRKRYLELLQSLSLEESLRKSQIVLIMLEMGRGVVPVSKEERRLRDVSGWLLQDAALLSNKVIYVWHGLARCLKEG
jgi:adenosylcobinamide kinase/adenosylcobinamide-phosphate guanylyltransferase